MDPPYIHRPRYVAVPSSNPNLFRPSPSSHVYHHHPHNNNNNNYLPPPQHQPLPPPPPPPPQQPVPPPPPPPPTHQQLHHHRPPLSVSAPPTKNPYNSHHHLQFTYNPSFNPKSHNLDHNQHQHHHQRSHDFVHRILVDDDRQHLHRQRLLTEFDAPSDVWDPPRIVPDHRPVVNNLEHNHPFDNQPMSPYRSIEKIKHELEMNQRFRERYSNDGFEFEHKSGNCNQREFVSRRSLFVSDSDRLKSGNYDNLHGSQFDGDEIRRSHVRDRIFDRQPLRKTEIRDSMIEIGQNSADAGGGIRGFSGKSEFYASDSGRYVNNRGSRENSYEYNRTPRKQLQKKSALLRIQKPCFRNRDNDELHYSGYYDQMKSSVFRGKDKDVYPDHGVGAEKEREGSPVELDVSFKSNSLVVNFGSAVVSDTNLTPKNGKSRNGMISDKHRSSQQMNKACNESIKSEHIKLGSSREDVNNASNSDNKDSKQSGNEVACPPISEMLDKNIQSCTNQANDSPGKITVKRSKCAVSGKGGTDVVTSKSRVKVAKKKRVVKKLVKKVMNPNVHATSLLPTENLDEPAKADDTTLNTPTAPLLKKGPKPSEEKITPPDMTSVHTVDLQPSPNKVTMSPENDKVGGLSHVAVGSEEVNADVDSGGSTITNIKRKMNNSNFFLASSIPKATGIDKGSVNADNSFGDSHNTDKDITKSPKGRIVSAIGEGEVVVKQLCHKGSTLLLENSATKESPKKLFQVGADINSDLLSSEGNKRNEGPVNTGVFADGMNVTISFNNGLVSSGEKINSSDIGTMDVSGKQPCKTQDCSAEEGFPLATLPTRINEMPTFPGSEEAEIDNVSIYADCSNHDKHSISGSDNVCVNSEGTYLGTVDCIGKQLSTSGVTVSLQKVAKKGLPNTIFSEGSEEEMPDITDEGKVMTCPSDLPDAMITDMYEGLVKAVSSAQSTNATLSFSVKESCPAAVKVTGSLDLGSQSCPNGFNVLHGSNLIGECSEALVTTNSDFIGTSPENRKRRKVSSCISGMPSQITSGITVGPVTTDLPTPAVGLPSRPNEDLIQPEGKVTISSMDTCLSSVVAASGSRNVFGIGGDDGSKIDQARADSCSTLKESCIPNAHGSCPPVFGSEQIINATPVMDGNNHSDEVMCMEGSKAEKMEAVAAEKQVTMCTEATQLKTISEHQSLELIERLAGRVMESNGYPLESYDLPSMSPHLAVAADGDGVSTTNFHDEIMELDTTVSDMGSPEILSSVPVMQSLNCEESTSQNSDDMVCGNEKMPNEKPVIEGISNLSSHTSSSQYVKNNLKSDCTLESAHLVVAGTGSLPSQDVKIAAPNLNSKNGETYGKKNQLSLAASRIHSSRSSFVFNSKKNTASSTHNTKPRTWHRTENTSSSSMPGNKSFLRAVAPQSHLPKKVAKLQGMSYIRKGNSLVRKPTPVAAFPQISHGLTSSVHQLNSSGLGELKKHTGCDSGADVIDPPNFLKTGGLHAPFERPRTPPLPTVTKVPTFTTNSSGDCTSSPLSEPPPNSCSEATSDALKSVESNNSLNSSNDTLKFSETPVNQTGLINSSESQVELNDGAFATSNVNRITYVKRKSNQLVAASNHHSSTIQKVDKTQGVTADGYYKRRKNQLIRASAEGQTNQSVNLADNDSISKGKTASKDKFGRSFSNGRSHKVVTKIHKPSRFSLVWTLKSMRSSLDNNHLLYPQKVLPSLFPWKKTAYWRRFVQNSVSITNNSSLSAISRKLLLLRNRDAVYTRSNHGFSLRKSKVFSVGGSNLKWSKSIEKRSKKANEEATLAVAAVERKKRGQNSAKSFSDTKNRSHSPRDRIFRIGSVRYRMDSSRRTLQRISDDESTCSAAVSSGKNAKNSYIPRRLVIGNDEYVRIGNGNQLIRDPKKRTRVLASEKVRWSLHTARLRLARKRKYCQFFTRFGKCNKGDGKCPYIHDPSKIAVCTKFLNGLCSNSNCKLTHKVIPERMPDCSYFLQGLCSNKDCPYRHVHVNPKASTCEGFLRGYCVDGNECRKKHSYVCPTFEATGSCPLGSKCKLHHPKSRSKGKKIRRSREQKNTRGRYFGSMSIEDLESRKLMSERHSMQDDGDICFEGRFTDYISLDVSDEEAGETNDAVNELTTFPESDASDLHFDDLDELIKPIGIMNIT